MGLQKYDEVGWRTEDQVMSVSNGPSRRWHQQRTFQSSSTAQLPSLALRQTLIFWSALAVASRRPKRSYAASGGVDNSCKVQGGSAELS